MVQSIEMIVKEDGAQLHLSSPEVGSFSCALPLGALLSPGQSAGVIRKLGQSITLLVPAGVSGRITNSRPNLINAPVGYGTPLYTLVPVSAESVELSTKTAAPLSSLAPSFRSPHSGRFWHRPAPGDPAFAEVGSSISHGDPIGLIEVMKTFTHLNYMATGELPQRARVTRVLVGDGAEVSEGDVLLEVEASNT